ncbi:DUF4194 domain-containing protein [Bradyrhizobium uaiense]|uniref:DUF4194 domain-containing protein n=1 Tax=Bradyrhizobium uaiense TaxID=2594946 RepID=A0A6P1BI63_9BRAD|nr:DUF4194 domain-containing protein [Bradyrhizobium uaiense]NEU97909.1 DUF4194 domain-containing protein [Bradyrhizobium uaiense]
MGNDAPVSIEHVKVRLLAGPLREDDDPDLWQQLFLGRDHLSRWFDELGVELVVHNDYRIALLRQTSDSVRERRAQDKGKAALPPLLQSRALTFLESQVLAYLHDKLNSAAGMGILDQSILRSEVCDAIINLQPDAQRNNEATLTGRINAALNKFKDYGLIEETQLSGQPAIQPQLILLVMVPRDELERFSGLIGDLVASGEPPGGGEDAGSLGGQYGE